ncbi:glycoside hydrolase superfamily [Zopfochytrium polystomum]|nr:glycoside hydrolase superfamily [Zopfochytrium polystomum]
MDILLRRNGDLNPGIEWSDAIAQAKVLVSKLSLEDKANLVTGLGWTNGPCLGNLPAMPSIGFPSLCLQDSPTGVRYAQKASAFPASINVAATFDKALFRKNGQKMGEEIRGKGVHVTLGPVMNMMRAPASGRGWEAAGGDPILTSFVASKQVEGIQSQGVIATAKHFILNEQEFNKDGGDSIADLRALYEVYLRPFKACVDAGVGAVMCSYNKVNGTYACQNPQILSILKDELGFSGFVMTDWWAAHVGNDTANAGTDVLMPGTSAANTPFDTFWGANLVRRRRGGMGQNLGYPATNFNSWDPEPNPVDVQEDHKNHIREPSTRLAAASSVLVKNLNHSLPFTKAAYKTIAVIGEDAAPPKTLNGCSDHGCIDGTVAQGWGSGTTNFPYIVAPVDGIKSQAVKQGINVVSYLETDNAQAAAVAQQADIAVVFGYITVEGNLGDRTDLDLWHNGTALVDAVAAVQKTVVVIHAPGPVNMPFNDNPNVVAIIYALMPGQETGNAIADDRTEYAADVQYNTNPVHYNEGILIDYRWFEATGRKPLYPFGHGLSYASFAYSNFQISTRVPGHIAYTVSVDVKNTAAVFGHEVVQLYVKLPASTCQPQGCSKELRDFERIRLNPGETKTVRFNVYTEDVQYYDVAKGGWTVPQGEVNVYVGASANDIRGSCV